MRTPHKKFSVIGLFVLAVMSLLLHHYFSVHYILTYIITINTITIGFYLYDKLISKTQKERIPEIILHFLALIGGSPGAIIATTLFRHKTSKKSFMLATWTIILLQLAIVSYLAYKGVIKQSD